MTGNAPQLARRLLLALLCSTIGSVARAALSPVFELQGDTLWIRTDGQVVPVSLRAPVFLVHGHPSAGNAQPRAISGAMAGGGALEVSYEPIPLGDSSTLEVKLLVRWSQPERVVRKWARVRLADAPGPRVLDEVVLDRIDAPAGTPWTHGTRAREKDGLVILDGPQSHPVFMPGLFLGVEFPVSSTRWEHRKVVLAHRPGRTLKPGVWYETRKAVFGLTPVGDEVQSFQRYVGLHRPKPNGFHVNYNSWWTLPLPYSERDAVGLMKVFEERLYKAHGVAFDTFAIDAGWSNAKSVWEIDAKRFPAGFAPLCDASRRMHASLGLWISPSSCYPFALDGDWARAECFETCAIKNPGDPKATVRLLCLGGKRYAERLEARLADLVARYGIHHLKLDGYQAECVESAHGHAPGPLSAEAIAEGLIGAVGAARRANPNVWAEATCFGYNPSPWWLFYVNSVIGTFGDDAPAGRVPAPFYRESYTSARDYFNLQGAALLPVPAGAQEVLGIVHQTPEPLMNDAVTTVMRGHLFLPLYVNPKFMTDARWKALAGLLTWARANSEILGQTVPLLPASWQTGNIPRFSDAGVMPREPYGYAHVRANAGLVCLRNPWIAPQAYTLKLDGTLGFSPALAHGSAVSLYPEGRVYGEGLKLGDALEVPLAPYETVVLSIQADAAPRGLPRFRSAIRSHVKVGRCDGRLERAAFQDSRKSLGPDWTCPLGDAPCAVRFTLDAEVEVAAPQAELLVLCEGEKPPAAPIGPWKLDGRAVQPGEASSATGWSATMLPAHEHWIFLRAPLAPGRRQISIDQYVGSDCTKISAWVWATKPGENAAHANSLPPPESISLDSAALLAPTAVAGIPKKAARAERPVERIDGVFLDALEPVSVTQGYGTLQKNRSVWEKPMAIGGRRFPRGLGTHAPSRIVFALEGKYRRFQTWAGPDANTSPTVTFEVWVDGAKRWQSGLMTRESPPAWLDLDVSGAKNLELVVGDAGDFMADHADWAEARLLR